MIKKIFIFFLSSFVSLLAQNYALVNGEVYTVTNGIIKQGTVLISDGKIIDVGKNISIPDDYEKIDCTNLKIYPGLIDAGSAIGLVEIGSLPETIDNLELGDFNPNVQTLTAINPNSVLIPVNRAGGVTTVLSEPQGSLFTGQSSLINLFGFTPEQMAVKKIAGLHLVFPSKGRVSSFDKSALKEREKRFTRQMENLDELWVMAENYNRNYQKAKLNNELHLFKKNFRFDPFISLFEKEVPLVITVNRDTDILRAIDWTKNKNINVIFSGVTEGWRVAKQIADAKIPCLVGPILSLPTRPEDRYDRPYTNPKFLYEAGVTIAFRTGESSNVRNLPFHTAKSIAYGLPEDVGLKALTIFPAQIFGVDNLIGSIEKGKIANIVVTDNNILEINSQTKYLFINGKNVSLENRQQELYEKFRKRD